MVKILAPIGVALALFALVVVLPRGPVHTGAGTQEDLAALAFLALQADDFEMFTPAVVSGKDIEGTFEHAVGGAEAARQRAAQRGGVVGLAAQARRRIQSSFDEARRKGAADFDWQNATFGGVDVEGTSGETIGAIEAGDVQFLVLAGDESIPVRLQQVFRSGDRWVLVGGFLYRPIEEGTPAYAALQTLERVTRAILMHRAIHGELPESLAALRQQEGHIGAPLLQRDAVDPWGKPVIYRRNDDGTFYVASPGADGMPGTDDDIKYAPR